MLGLKSKIGLKVETVSWSWSLVNETYFKLLYDKILKGKIFFSAGFSGKMRFARPLQPKTECIVLNAIDNMM